MAETLAIQQRYQHQQGSSNIKEAINRDVCNNRDEMSVTAARSSATAGSISAGMLGTATAVKPLTVGTPAT